MTPFEAQVQDQEFRLDQGLIAREWHIYGETDGDEGQDPEYPANSAYMDGYSAGRTRYIRWLADFKKPENRRLCHCGLVREQDCTCAFGWSDEF